MIFVEIKLTVNELTRRYKSACEMFILDFFAFHFHKQMQIDVFQLKFQKD